MIQIIELDKPRTKCKKNEFRNIFGCNMGINWKVIKYKIFNLALIKIIIEPRTKLEMKAKLKGLINSIKGEIKEREKN